MAGESDLPYIRDESGVKQAMPIFDGTMYRLVDHSGFTIDANPFFLFGEGGFDVSCRVLANLSETESLWVNMTGGLAGVRLPGSIEVPPGAVWPLPTRQPISVIGTSAGIPYTAMEG